MLRRHLWMAPSCSSGHLPSPPHQGYCGTKCNSQYVQLPAWRSSSKCNKVRNNISPRYISVTSLWMYQYINILCAGLRATEAPNGVPYWSCSHPSTFVWPDTARGHWALIKLSTVLGAALHSGNTGTGLQPNRGFKNFVKQSFCLLFSKSILSVLHIME